MSIPNFGGVFTSLTLIIRVDFSMNTSMISQPSNCRLLLNLIRRLHFYIGLFIAPFIFIAAVTGLFYIATPQLEQIVYRSTLTVVPQGEAQPLAAQIAAARKKVGNQVAIFAVRPAPTSNSTTRVQFSEPGLGPSESRAIFIDPYRLKVTGDYTVYGTSGILPLRTTLDHLHQSLLLGSVGRLYSELAASWMWVAAVGGLFLWMTSRNRTAKRDERSIKSARHWHSILGLMLIIGMLFLSVTGITWSQWAGERVSQLRSKMDWMTPQVNSALNATLPATSDPHAEHHTTMSVPDMPDMPGMNVGLPNKITPKNPADSDWQRVLTSAQQAGLSAAKIELRPPRNTQVGWVVTEIDQRWPLKVDAVAINPSNFNILDKVDFAHYPLAAKLTRWGVSAHMGVLFGWPNQLLLGLFAVGLCVMIGFGYRLWWLRRPDMDRQHPAETLFSCWLAQPFVLRVLTAFITVLLGYALPMLGLSLTFFVLIDILRWRNTQRLVRLAQGYPQLQIPTEIWGRERQKGRFIIGVVMIWLMTSLVMSQAIIGGVIDEYHLAVGQWSPSMFLMQGSMVVLYTSVFTALMSIPLWYFFVGTNEE